MRFNGIIAALATFAVLAGCGQESAHAPLAEIDPGLRYEAASRDCCGGRVYRTRGTAYYPYNDRMQGGHFDRRGKKLVTLQDYLEGKSDYAAVAMDAKVLPYGTAVCIPHLNKKYGASIPFRVVDTGGAFRNKKTSRMDVCTRSKKHSRDAAINRSFEFIVCEDQRHPIK